MTERFRHGALIALGLATVVGLASPAVAEDSAKKKKKAAEEPLVGVLSAAAIAPAPTSTSTSTTKRGAFVGLLTARADDPTTFRANLLNRRSGVLEDQAAELRRLLGKALGQFDQVSANPSNPRYQVLLGKLVFRTNNLSATLERLTSVVDRLVPIDPRRGIDRSEEALQTINNAAPLYSRVAAIAAANGLLGQVDLVVATPSFL